MTVWIDLEGIMLSEISQRKILYDLTYVESGGKKKTATTKKTRNQIHWYRKQIGGAIGKGWKVGKMGEGSQNIQTSN